MHHLLLNPTCHWKRGQTDLVAILPACTRSPGQHSPHHEAKFEQINDYTGKLTLMVQSSTESVTHLKYSMGCLECIGKLANWPRSSSSFRSNESLLHLMRSILLTTWYKPFNHRSPQNSTTIKPLGPSLTVFLTLTLMLLPCWCLLLWMIPLTLICLPTTKDLHPPHPYSF